MKIFSRTINFFLNLPTYQKLILYLLVYSIIIVFSLLPKLTITETEISNIDKLFHFISYFSLSFLIMQLFHRKYEVTFLIIISIVLSIFIEFLQDIIPGRDTSLLDIVANVIGMLAGMFFGFYLKKKILKKFALKKAKTANLLRK